MKPRGTTVTVRYRDDEWRTDKWGVFWYAYAVGHVGRPKARAKFYATEAEAMEVATAVRTALLDASAPEPFADEVVHRQADSLAAIAVSWLADVKDQKDAATHKNYQGVVTHYLAPAPSHPRYPGLGNVIVSDKALTPKAIADFLKALGAQGVTLSMRRRVHRALSSFCTYARFEGRLAGAGNPCTDLGRRIRRKDESETPSVPHPFTSAEIATIFDHVAAAEEAWLPYYQFLLDVGVRGGEAAALRWTDLRLDRARATIAQSWCRVAREDKPPKNHEPREVQLTKRVVEQLTAWRAVQREAAFRRGRPVPAYVFTSQRLARALPDGQTRLVFDRVMKACGITGHTPHDFRDTFATSHLVEDWNRKLAWVSRQLGHKQVSTTINFYFGFVETAKSGGFADEIQGWGGGR